MYIVCAPGKYANAQLNGSEAIVVHDNPSDQGVTVLLLSGPSAGREWQLLRDHLTLT